MLIGNSTTDAAGQGTTKGEDSGSQLKRNLLIGVYDALVVMPSAFVHRPQMTLFDTVYIITAI